MIEQILTTFAVMALLLGVLWWLRRQGVARFGAALAVRKAQRSLELLERLPLSPQHSLHLVRAGTRSLLIGVSPSGCSLMESWEIKPGESGRGELG